MTPAVACRVNDLQRSQKSQQALAFVGRQLQEPAACHVRFILMAPDRLVDGRRAPVVQERAPESQPPERRCANLFRPCRGLGNAVTRSDIVQKQVRKQRHGPPVEQRIGAGTGRQRRDVAGRASDSRKDPLAVAYGLVNGGA